MVFLKIVNVEQQQQQKEEESNDTRGTEIPSEIFLSPSLFANSWSHHSLMIMILGRNADYNCHRDDYYHHHHPKHNHRNKMSSS